MALIETKYSRPNHPTMTTPPWQIDGYQHIWMPYTQMQTAPLPVPVVGTDGVSLILADGRRVIDGLASWWSACHGYRHPHIEAAVERQLKAMPHVMFGGINHEPALRLAQRLAALLPGDLNRVFFSESGSVSVEVAMKMAAQYWLNRGVRGRTKFVSFLHAYHGDTITAMSVCDPVNGMHAHFRGFLPEQFNTDLPLDEESTTALDRLLGEHRDEIAAVMLEPIVQGAGGMRFHPPETVATIRQLCDAHDVLLIADEIATGFARTGTMFACEQADVVPDIMCVSKALTGGTMPMAATAATDRVFEAFLSDDPAHALMHGPTFMANPLACAAAHASLDLFEREPRLEQARVIETAIAEQLADCRELPGVVDVRAKGAIGVIQVDQLRHVGWLRERFLEEGVWIRPFGDAIYITPSLVISPEDLSTLCAAMVAVVTQWSELGE
nr:adenosylmethionine--8-amino-7-oxononanoate transaminase [Symmachiella macrocystis]